MRTLFTQLACPFQKKLLQSYVFNATSHAKVYLQIIKDHEYEGIPSRSLHLPQNK